MPRGRPPAMAMESAKLNANSVFGEDHASFYFHHSDGLKGLEKRFLDVARERIRAEVATGPKSDPEFEGWFLREKAPAIYEAEKARFIEEYERSYEFAFRSKIVDKPLSELKKDHSHFIILKEYLIPQ